MKIRPSLLAALAATHLALVIAGATHYPVGKQPNLLSWTLSLYGGLSGSETTYGFFAPKVAPELVAKFTLVDEQGRTFEVTPQQGVTHEANLRFESTISMVVHPQFHDAVPASWAAALLGRHPDAVEVRVTIQAQDLPHMGQYQAGCRTRWITIYDKRFKREHTRINET